MESIKLFKDNSSKTSYEEMYFIICILTGIIIKIVSVVTAFFCKTRP